MLAMFSLYEYVLGYRSKDSSNFAEIFDEMTKYPPEGSSLRSVNSTSTRGFLAMKYPPEGSSLLKETLETLAKP